MHVSELGKRIRTERRKKGYTLKFLQQSTGVHYTHISKMERGDCKLLSKNLLKVCDFLHISQQPHDEPEPSQKVMDRVQALIRLWPQSEGLICHFLEGLETALERGQVNK
ncbi:hypothetical protein CO724_00375 [Ectopseudomonas mendocina]|nr:hypothetical protein CO724_00375 [Pseudomonas mendocina]